MSKVRLDQALVEKGLAATRSQAENFIKLGYVKIGGKVNFKPGFQVDTDTKIALTIKEQYVSRAAFKLAGVAGKLKLDFARKTVLDVGSSTGGFTDYALKHGAKKIIAVDVGSKQMHPSVAANAQVELHEKTDIRELKKLSAEPDIILIDVSFISLRDILPHIKTLCGSKTRIAAMCKPQFEAGTKDIHKGVIKNETLRRQILRNFEDWTKKYFVIIDKADSGVRGAKGNTERFYLLAVL